MISSFQITKTKKQNRYCQKLVCALVFNHFQVEDRNIFFALKRDCN